MVRVRLQCSNSAVFAGNGIDIMHMHDHDDNSSLFMSSASLSWQRLQLVLCHTNNFYGKVLSVDGQLLTSNIIDTVRFFEELWDIIGVSVFLETRCIAGNFRIPHWNQSLQRVGWEQCLNANARYSVRSGWWMIDAYWGQQWQLRSTGCTVSGSAEDHQEFGETASEQLRPRARETHRCSDSQSEDLQAPH